MTLTAPEGTPIARATPAAAPEVAAPEVVEPEVAAPTEDVELLVEDVSIDGMCGVY